MENPNRNFKSQTCEDFIEVLASKAADYVNGTLLVVDGGYLVR